MAGTAENSVYKAKTIAAGSATTMVGPNNSEKQETIPPIQETGIISISQMLAAIQKNGNGFRYNFYHELKPTFCSFRLQRASS
jgi:hypothetical protein